MFFFLVVLPAFSQNSYRDLKQTGPKNLVIVYRCAPENRVRLRNYMTKTGVDHFRNWQEQGILQNFRFEVLNPDPNGRIVRLAGRTFVTIVS